MDSSIGPSEVERYSFSVLGDEEHETRGACEVTSWELYSGTQPISGGVHDLRMGTTDHQWRCTTCSHEKKLDPGHPGYIKLKVPVPDPLQIGEIRRWLKVICLACGSPIVDPEQFTDIPASKRLNTAASGSTEGIKCTAITGADGEECGTVHPKIVKDPEDYFTFFAPPPETPENKQSEYKLQPHIIKAAFERIADDTVVKMGRRLDVHPRKLIHSVIQAPANTIRPGVRSIIGSSASYHDSTSMLQWIVKRNQQLPTQIPDVIDQNLDKSIYNLCQAYYDFILGSASTSATQGSSGKRGLVMGTRPAPSIMRRLPRKQGRIRLNMLGKRTFFISRTTISGNTRLKINQLGIPKKYARTLQVRERVTMFNIERLMKHFLNGKRQYPGCTQIEKGSTGVRHDVENKRRDFQLEIGDYIWRDIVDGDVGFYNRQPTLERSSIGVHELIVLEDEESRTFQMNVSVCANYNADQRNKIHQGLQQVAAL